MRATHTEQEGGAGEHEVAAALERLGWGMAENIRHDNGTDLFIFARDERGFELGLYAGVQVKSGPSWFTSPTDESKGDAPGWWFYESDPSHIDSWIKLGLPHLLVLNDGETRTSYWVHVTADSVVSTGKGAKILVPRANTLDERHQDELLAVASSMWEGLPLEGTAWGGLGGLAPSDRLRHALIVPRLIAPHPNEFPGELGFEQAAAMLVQVRVQELDRFAGELPDVPDLAAAKESTEWGWRFVGALADRVFDDDPSGLASVIDDAPSSSDRVATVVCAASALLAAGRVGDATDLLDRELDRDEAETVDFGWLQVQLARSLVEIGRTDDARSLAARLQGLPIQAPTDVTARAITGAAAALVFNTSSWGSRDIRALVKGSDTVAGWWGAQTISSGLSALTARTFGAWAQDRTVTLGGEDTANNRLFAAALADGHGGDQAAWRFSTSLLGQDELLRLDRNAEPGAAAAGLETLRLAGSQKDVKLATNRLSDDGPAEAITLAIERLDLDLTTRTSVFSDLTLLEFGGDLATIASADRHVGRLLEIYEDPRPLTDSTSPTFRVSAQIAAALSGIAPAADQAVQRGILDRLLSLDSPMEEFEQQAWARLLVNLPDTVWTEDLAERARQAAGHNDTTLSHALMVVAAVQGDQEARVHLRNRAIDGSYDALAGLGPVRELPGDVAKVAIGRLVAQVKGQIEEAENGTYGMGYDIGRPLVLLNAWHADSANWSPLLDLLSTNSVAVKHKIPALRMLARLADRLPPTIGERLSSIALGIVRSEIVGYRDELDGDAELRGPAAELAASLGVLTPDLRDSLVVELLGGSTAQRRAAAALAALSGGSERDGVLVVLMRDDRPAVRAEAAEAAVRLIADGAASPMSSAGLLGAIVDPGRRVPLAISRAITDVDRSSPFFDEARERLRSHISAAVRQVAAS